MVMSMVIIAGVMFLETDGEVISVMTPEVPCLVVSAVLFVHVVKEL